MEGPKVSDIIVFEEKKEDTASANGVANLIGGTCTVKVVMFLNLVAQFLKVNGALEDQEPPISKGSVYAKALKHFLGNKLKGTTDIIRAAQAALNAITVNKNNTSHMEEEQIMLAKAKAILSLQFEEYSVPFRIDEQDEDFKTSAKGFNLKKGINAIGNIMLPLIIQELPIGIYFIRFIKKNSSNQKLEEHGHSTALMVGWDTENHQKVRVFFDPNRNAEVLAENVKCPSCDGYEVVAGAQLIADKMEQIAKPEADGGWDVPIVYIFCLQTPSEDDVPDLL